MHLGYLRVSKADGTQSLDLQRDAVLAAGVEGARLYEDTASGRLEARPGLEAVLKALRLGDTLVHSWWCGSWTGSGAAWSTWSTPCTR